MKYILLILTSEEYILCDTLEDVRIAIRNMMDQDRMAADDFEVYELGRKGAVEVAPVIKFK